DVVRINSGHSIIAKPLAHVAVLCIEPNAQLLSADEQGTPLQIQAARYIANKGEIIGRNGTDEQPHGLCLQKKDIHEQPACAQRGASVVLKVGRHIEKTLVDYRQWQWHNDDISGPILNEGKIIAGDGGNGKHYGANGGHALVISQNILNKGVVIAGDGGDITGLGAGRGGLGGITQLWANLNGRGYLYNQADAVALAGNGGQCQPNAVERQTGGVGGDLWLMASYLYLKGGLYQAGQGGSHCFRDGEPGQRLRIEPNLIDISGAQTQIQGDDIAIYGGKDWRLNFSHLNTIVVEAEDKLTLAVGEGGVIDFRGNQVPILQAQGQVNIFADTILLDEGMTLADLIEAKTIEVGPQRILRAVSLTGAGKFVGAPGETIQVQLILANNSPEADQFTLESLDPSGQIAAQMPTTLAVPALSTVELIFSFTLPAAEGGIIPLTITAISQAAPEVQATHSFQLAAVTPTWVITQDNDIKINDNSLIEPSEESEFIDFTDTQAGQVPIVEQCPTTGFINWVCRNDGQTMSDVYLGRRAAIAGGSLKGTIDNHGLVSQVTLKADAVLIGGKLSGYIVNQGWLESFEFVGAALNGGTLAGHIINNSRIGGVLRNVNLAAHTQVRGGYLAGTIQGDAQAPALLEQLSIKAGSTVSHVIIGSGVNIAEDVVLASGVQWQ
ncbi:MAG: hypothetical protein SVR94_05050, partial [Pseudomonadota bacterium]|nr:hypothetical protein [Pseudomonadota bacterium]